MPEELTTKQKKEVDKQVNKQVKEQLAEVEKKVEESLRHKILMGAIHKTSYFSSQFRDHAATAIIAAFSFLIALVWKDLIVKIVDERVKLTTIEKYPYFAELSTALIVTLIAVVSIALISKWSKKPSAVLPQ